MTRESGSWEGRIESVTQDGLGVGTYLFMKDGKHHRRPVFIPFTVPGDIVVANVTDNKRKYLFGEISAVLKESPMRVIPRCPHFMTCGGCNLQHIAYEEQLKQKGKQITYLLQRKGIALPGDVTVLPAEQREHYRWRGRIAMRFDGAVLAGFRKQRSKEIVKIETCIIVHERIVDLITLLNDATTQLEGIELEVTAVVGERGKVGLLVALDDVPVHAHQGVKEFFETIYGMNRQLIGNVFFEEKGKLRSYGQVQEHFTYPLDGLTISFLPETFIQANIPTNTVLVREVIRMLACKEQDVVLDLYAGIGNLTLPVAKRAAQVIGVEGSNDAVLAGTTNALRNGMRNVTFFHQGVEAYLREYVRRCKEQRCASPYLKADCIVVDPPRTGLSPAVRKLLADGPKTMVYVSCDPASLAEDLHELSVYKVKEVIGIDMFPNVSHVETLVLLERQ